MLLAEGRMSIFGGPDDLWSSKGEGLALFDERDVPRHPELFVSLDRPAGGMLRRLNPLAFYVACRWNYRIVSRGWLRTNKVLVTNVKTGKSALAQPVDWGPNVRTGRVADLSPGLARALDLWTDDICRVETRPPPEPALVAAGPVTGKAA